MPKAIIKVPDILFAISPPYIARSICLENIKAMGICINRAANFASNTPARYIKMYHQCSVKVKYRANPITKITPTS